MGRASRWGLRWINGLGGIIAGWRRFMTTLNIPLSEEAKRFLEEEAAKRGLPDSGAVVARLVREAMSRERDEAELELKLDEGLNSGPGIEADDAYWDRRQADLVRHANAARGGRG